MKTVGQIVREARIAAGVTQEALAKALGLTSDQIISEFERDKCSVAPKHFREIARMLHMNIDVLIEAHMAEYRDKLKRKVG